VRILHCKCKAQLNTGIWRKTCQERLCGKYVCVVNHNLGRKDERTGIEKSHRRLKQNCSCTYIFVSTACMKSLVRSIDGHKIWAAAFCTRVAVFIILCVCYAMAWLGVVWRDLTCSCECVIAGFVISRYWNGSLRSPIIFSALAGSLFAGYDSFLFIHDIA